MSVLAEDGGVLGVPRAFRSARCRMDGALRLPETSQMKARGAHTIRDTHRDVQASKDDRRERSRPEKRLERSRVGVDVELGHRGPLKSKGPSVSLGSRGCAPLMPPLTLRNPERSTHDDPSRDSVLNELGFALNELCAVGRGACIRSFTGICS